jgi:hypothetical protein
MQGRFHDALLIKYHQNSFSADVGVSYSQDGQNVLGNDYLTSGFFSYKTMQYLYAHKEWNKTKVSFLFLNNGFQAFDTTSAPAGLYNRQTTGVYFSSPINNLTLSGSGYLQFGMASKTQVLSAYQTALNAAYKIKSGKVGIGAEILSGTSQSGGGINTSFFPLYGTNHKFNGFMDFFYVGNHANSVGLNDFHASYVANIRKSKLLVRAHYFTSNAELVNDADRYLGTEFDLVFTKKFTKSIKFQVGYSHMFPTESMELIKGGVTSDNLNNWAWMQLIIKPTLFSIGPEKNTIPFK